MIYNLNSIQIGLLQKKVMMSSQFRREPIQKEIVKKPNLDTNSHAALNATSSPPWRPHPSGKRHQHQSAPTPTDSPLPNAAQSRSVVQKRTQTTSNSLRITSIPIHPLPHPPPLSPPSTPPWSTTSLGSSSPRMATLPATVIHHHALARSSLLLA